MHWLPIKIFCFSCASSRESPTLKWLCHALNWWESSGGELKNTASILDRRASLDTLVYLVWWARSGLELRRTESARNNASSQGHVHGSRMVEVTWP
ncbi:hypothetical protein BJ742DRAFT_145236 [Cladochytrium replicatum]|nr:hypothetical protein BJ742DRAFT_145236 [Cladochytrium replicatum]